MVKNKKTTSRSKPRSKDKKASQGKALLNFLKRFWMIPVAALFSILFLIAAISLREHQNEPKAVLSQVTQTNNYIGPVLTGSLPAPQLDARAAYAMDLATGQVFFDKMGDEPMLPASTTKITTAMVVLNNYNLDDVITVSPVNGITGSTMGLIGGEQISVRNLLFGLLISSSNDAAEVLARNFPGGREAFIQEMNKVAGNNGLEKSHYVNPAGFDAYLHFSTASDLVHLASIAIKNPIFADIVSRPAATVTSVDGKYIHNLISTNKLLGRNGVIGVKTGSTLSAGESLVTLVERDNHKVMIAVLHSPDRFQETETLIDWVFANYSWGKPTL